MTGPEKRLRRNSDQILKDLDRLKVLERSKRKLRISSPEFDALAREIETITRRVFGRTMDEAAAADLAEDDKTIEDVTPEKS